MNQKKKVIIAITKGNWGGAQKYVYDLALNIPKDKFEVKVLIGEDGELVSKLQENNIPIIRIGSIQRDIKFNKDTQSIKKLVNILKAEKPDVLHLNSSKMGLIGAIAGKMTGVKNIIFTVHGWAFNEKRPWWQRKIFKYLQLLTISLSSQIIAVSEQTKNQTPCRQTCLRKVVVIKNGINKLTFLNKDEAISEIEKKIQNKIKGNYLIGCIAELHKNKGLNFLIEALANINKNNEFKFKTIIIGEGEERQNLEKQISENNLGDAIYLAGRISQASRLLKAFDVFILPSITEALPYVLLEAGQAGLPIISTNVGGVSEIIKDAESGLIIKPSNTKDLANAIIYLRSNLEKTLILSQKIQEKIETEFNIKDMIDKTIALY